MKRPCDNCPWRKDASVSTIPGFRPALMQQLALTCIGQPAIDDLKGLKVMACHKSTDEQHVPCAGFVVAVGWESVGLRLAVWRRILDPDEFTADGIPLHASFEEMLAANGVPMPDPRAPLAARCTDADEESGDTDGGEGDP